MGGAVRQDVLAVTDVDEEPKDASDDDNFAARVALRQANKNSTKEGSVGCGRDKSNKANGAWRGLEWH